MTAWLRRIVLPWLVPFAALSCTVHLDSTSASGSLPENQCTDNSDCGLGKCWSGACVAYGGDLSSLLVEVAPPTSAQLVGGIRDLRILSGLDQSNEDTKIDLRPATTVRGFVSPGTNCPGERSVQVRVTVTPQEESYGLSAQSYVAETQQVLVDATDPCGPLLRGSGTAANDGSVYEFAVTVPGNLQSLYDVYVEPLVAPALSDAGVPVACSVVPQLKRGVSASGCVKVIADTPVTEPVVIPWPASAAGEPSLDGYTVDVIHPVTGAVLSDTVVLRASDWSPDGQGGGSYTRPLRFSLVAGDTTAKELVRLTPPTGVVAPTIYAERAALEAARPDKAVFPNIGPFPSPVLVESWVWQEGTEADHPVAVPGSVELTATKLDGVRAGIFATHTVTVDVGEDGKLSTRLLPGEYRARIVPRVGLGLAAAETRISVACTKTGTSTDCAASGSADGGAPQAGKLISVPRAARVTGGLVNAAGGGAADRATVELRAATIDRRACPFGQDAAACSEEPLGVLDVALGEDAFVPRTSSAVVNGGQFVLPEVDCGSCTAEGPALFDLVARSADGTAYPWFVRPNVSVAGDLALGTLTVPLPIIHHGVVEIPSPDREAVPIANALIRAYVLRDQSGAVIDSPAGLQDCGTAATTRKAGSPTARCIRSVLQVAETRAGPDGRFELVLPSALE
ncbi:MAG TPA: hypothetical protein VHE30_14065 [Polyangiaceae bacterium]|nr:hypothetical protein [Polyangiaceae bacterium]